jgi:hypothetical protein
MPRSPKAARPEAAAFLDAARARLRRVLCDAEDVLVDRLVDAGCEPRLVRPAVSAAIDEILADIERELVLPNNAAARADA